MYVFIQKEEEKKGKETEGEEQAGEEEKEGNEKKKEGREWGAKEAKGEKEGKGRGRRGEDEKGKEEVKGEEEKKEKEEEEPALTTAVLTGLGPLAVGITDIRRYLCCCRSLQTLFTQTTSLK